MADTSEKDGKMAAESNQGALAEGLMQIFRPAVEELDSKVISVRYHDAPILSFEDKRAFQFLGMLASGSFPKRCDNSTLCNSAQPYDLNIPSAMVVKMSVTNNSSFQNYPQRDNRQSQNRGILVYNICLISISNSVSDGATNKSVLNIESSYYD